MAKRKRKTNSSKKTEAQLPDAGSLKEQLQR